MEYQNLMVAFDWENQEILLHFLKEPDYVGEGSIDKGQELRIPLQWLENGPTHQYWIKGSFKPEYFEKLRDGQQIT